MNVTQLQIVINEIYDYSGILNEILMKSLVERDELLSNRDAMLTSVEKNSGQQRTSDRIEKLIAEWFSVRKLKNVTKYAK